MNVNYMLKINDLLTGVHGITRFYWIHRTALVGKYPCGNSFNVYREELNTETGYFGVEVKQIRKANNEEKKTLQDKFGLTSKLEMINDKDWKKLYRENWFGKI